MRRAWGYRLFGAGRMPAELRSSLRDSLLVEEGVPMTLRRNFRRGGRIALGNIRAESCALAVLAGEVVVAFRGAVVKARPAPDGGGAGTIEVSAERIEILIDVAKVTPDGTGEIRLTCKWPLPAAALAALPRSASVAIEASDRLTRMP